MATETSNMNPAVIVNRFDLKRALAAINFDHRHVTKNLGQALNTPA